MDIPGPAGATRIFVMTPLISVITPTISERAVWLLDRCLPSVAAQTHPNLEHVIVCDGPWAADGQILAAEVYRSAQALAAGQDREVRTKIVELGRNWRQFTLGAQVGAVPRIVGTHLAAGEYIAYLDDDDEFLPEHCAKLLAHLQATGSDFVFSRFQRIFYQSGREVGRDVIGSEIRYGCIGTPLILHKAECLRHVQWSATEGYGEDFGFVDRLAKFGFKWSHLPEITVIVHKQV